MDCVDEVRLPGNLPADLFDTYCPIMSLAGVLEIDEESLPKTTPYISISKQVVVPTLEDNGKPKIGLVWAGSPTQQINHHRSCPIEDMMAITANEQYDFYSLQLPISTEHQEILGKHNITNLEQELVSYSHTGALIQQMDLVISVCTSVVHLSGALNIPSIVLLSPHTDWRWLVDEKQSTWYPNTKILRQKKSGDWAEIVKRAGKEIEKVLIT